MELSAAIYARHSTRSYTGGPVSDGDLNEIVKAATFAPSAMNEQACHFTLVSRKTLLRKISADAKSYALQEFGRQSHIDHVRQMLTDAQFDIFYGAPVLVVISAPETSRWVVEDCALAAENLMLAAAARGLGTCWIGFAQGWLGTSEGRSAISLPSGLLPVAPIIVGHPRVAVAPVPRKPPQMHWIRD